MIHTSMYSQVSVGVRTHAYSLNKARPGLANSGREMREHFSYGCSQGLLEL